MGTLSSPFNYDTAVSPETTDPATGKKSRSPFFDQAHVDWWLEQQQRVNASAQRSGSILTLANQGASIAATALIVAPTAGLYRVNVYARITRAGSVSSSLIVTIGHTDTTVLCSQPLTALTTNTTASTRVASFPVYSDASVAITFATTYVDGGGPQSMQYGLQITVEQMPT